MQHADDVVANTGFVPFSARVSFDDLPPRNHVLASLNARLLASLKPHVESYRLAQDEVLFDAGQTITHVYFPVNAGVSLVNVIGGRLTLAGTVGCEGMVGIEVFLGEASSPHRASTHLAGTSWRLSADVFKRFSAAAGPFHRSMLQYAHAFLAQVIETHRCNVAHLVEQRCARWLLLTSRRADAPEFGLELDLLALVMEVRTGAVSLALRALEQRGLVEYRRNRVRILDRGALEEAACTCALNISTE